MLSKVKIVALALLLLESFAGQCVFGTLAKYSATQATITKLLTNNPPSVNNSPVNNTSPQDNSSETVIQEANGSRIYIFRFVTVSRDVVGLSASAGYETIIISPIWFFLENLFDFLRDAQELMSDTLLCVFCAVFVLELERRAIPKWFPLIGR